MNKIVDHVKANVCWYMFIGLVTIGYLTGAIVIRINVTAL